MYHAIIEASPGHNVFIIGSTLPFFCKKPLGNLSSTNCLATAGILSSSLYLEISGALNPPCMILVATMTFWATYRPKVIT